MSSGKGLIELNDVLKCFCN